MSQTIVGQLDQCLGKRTLQLHLGPPSPAATLAAPPTADTTTNTANTTTVISDLSCNNKRACTMAARAEAASIHDATTTATTTTTTSNTTPPIATPFTSASAAAPASSSHYHHEHGNWDASSWATDLLPAPFLPPQRPVYEPSEEGRSGKSVDESCRRALDHFPSPAVAFPTPSLEFDFRVAVALKQEPSQVQGRAHKEIIAVSSGSWSGSFGHGKVLAGGYDLGQARGFRPIRIVEGAFIMQTTDEPPARLEMRTRGSLSGPCDILDSLLSPRSPKQIDPRKYGFRMFLTIKTADKRYAEIVNCGLWVASGVWRDEELLIDAYRVT